MEGLEGTKDYTLGMRDLIVATDHKPLIGVFKRPLGEIDNPRLLNLVQKTLWYQFKVVHVPGKVNTGPDFISSNMEKVSRCTPASQKGEWCMKRAISTPSSCVDGYCSKELGEGVP